MIQRAMRSLTLHMGDATGTVIRMWEPPTDMTARAIYPIDPIYVGGTCQYRGSFGIKLPSHEEHEIVFRKLDGVTVQIAGRISVCRVTNNFGAVFSHPSLLGIANTGSDEEP